VALTPKFNRNDIIKKLLADKEKIEGEIIESLKLVGEKFIINARSTDTYKDQTGNLRSSIGFVILKDGEQIFGSDFALAKKGTDRVTGQKTGIRIADEASSKFQRGIVLIVVAGMDYAAAVESKNLDVITGSSFIAEADLRKSLNELKSKL
jgi:co-chaperonin GroES (HSP10)